jgi:hypothetical protein
VCWSRISRKQKQCRPLPKDMFFGIETFLQMNLKLPHLRTQATVIGLLYFRDEYSRVHVDEGDLESILEGKYIVHSPDYIGRTFATIWCHPKSEKLFF